MTKGVKGIVTNPGKQHLTLLDVKQFEIQGMLSLFYRSYSENNRSSFLAPRYEFRFPSFSAIKNIRILETKYAEDDED